MSSPQTWLVTGAGRGLGVDIARAALAAGHQVIATARDSTRVATAVGAHENLLAVGLDVTDSATIAAAVRAGLERFGRIDVLVNNAGNFQPGFFEEVSPAQFRAQMDTNFFGALDVTRVVLPVMRQQRAGHVVTVTSTAGVVSGAFGSAYGASKFALEGWMDSLREEVAPFGIATTVVEPGFFRTELLVEGSSTTWPELSVEDYAATTATTIEQWRSMNGRQSGDPAKLAVNLVRVLALPEAPVRWAAGADAVEAIAQKGRDLERQATALVELSTGLEHDGQS